MNADHIKRLCRRPWSNPGLVFRVNTIFTATDTRCAELKSTRLHATGGPVHLHGPRYPAFSKLFTAESDLSWLT